MIKKILVLCLIISSISLAEDFEIEEDFVAASELTTTELINKIEKLEHQIRLQQKKIESLEKDLEYRLRELENKKHTSTPAEKKTESKPKADAKQAKVHFQEALFLLQDQQYEEAEQAFTQFISDYPNDTYTGNAYYWLGESFMLQKRYDKASLNYLQSFSKFPKNDKADLSMLKLSTALRLLNKKKESCSILTKLKARKSSLNQSIQSLLQKELKSNSCNIK